MNLGENLRRIREARQISRQTLADELNLSCSSICKYECGHRTPDYDSLVKMARVFQVSIEQLLTGHLGESGVKYPIVDLPADIAHECPETYDDAEQTQAPELSEDEAYLLKLYRGLEPKLQAAVLELIGPISLSQEPTPAPKFRLKNRKAKMPSL